MTARRKRPRLSAWMRSRVLPFHGITLRQMPDEARSAAMFSGAATAMPPSCLKRCCNARYVGRARMLSPTQFNPITTVSLLAIQYFAFPRPLPTIVHPQPELGAGGDAARDDVVESRRQRHRISFRFAQLIDAYRLLELQPMPEAVRYAKSEHNCRTALEGHLRRCVGRPRFASDERHQNAFARLHRLIGKHHHEPVVGECFHQRARRVATIDDLRAGALAQPREVPLEQLVVERTRDREHMIDPRHDRQSAHFPSAPVTAHQQHAFAVRVRFVEIFGVDERAALRDLVQRQRLDADELHGLAPEMAPACVNHAPALSFRHVRKGVAEVAHGELVALAQHLSAERPEPFTPPSRAPFGRIRNQARRNAIGGVLDALQQRMLASFHTRASMAAKTSSGISKSMRTVMMSLRSSLIASFSVVTSGPVSGRSPGL